MRSLPRRAKGFALILALFLIVSLAAIGAYLLTVSNVQVESGIMDEQSARAYQAARGGVEWGAYQVLQSSNCWAGTATMPFPADLNNFSASVTCTPPLAPETEGGASIAIFRITSTGCNAASCPGAAVPGYVERQLQLTVAN
jgi:MSHA biogenesis protein MshP